MVTVSSPSPTSRHSLALPLPSSGISASRGGGVGSETNFAMSSYNKRLGLVRLLQSEQYPETEVISY
jgi:hypothetical protein